MSLRTRKPLGRIFFCFGLGVLVFIIAFPLYWMILTSLKTSAEIYSRTPTFFPRTLYLGHYVNIVKEGLSVYYKNSLMVAMSATSFSMLIAILAAYSLSHFRYKGRQTLSQMILFVYLFPAAVLFIPLLIVVNFFGLTDTLSSLILVYPVFGVPFATWLLTGYFSTIPRELEEAARIDGCGRIGALFRVILPVALPGVITATVYCFLLSWNELLYAFTFISTESKKTTPMWLSERILGDVYLWGELMAGAVLMLIPILTMYLLGQKYIIQGLTAGAVKE